MKRKAVFENAPLRVKACRHGTMMYYATDAYIGRSLDRYGEFSEGETALFQQIVRPGMVVLDIGANIGAHTLFFARTVGLAGYVHAFEPQRLAHQLLCGNLALNRIVNTSAHQTAIGTAPGSLHVPVIDYTKDGNFGGLSLGTWTHGEQVPVVTLDSLRLGRCDFIKIDVEGMEREALEGGAETLGRLRPLLYIENDRADKSPALIEYLFRAEYRLYWHLPPLFNAQNFFGEKENLFGNILSINMVCVPKALNIAMNGFPEITAPDADWRNLRPS